MTTVPPTPAPSPAPLADPVRPERGLLSAYVGYGLLLASLFTGGVSAFVAMIIAYDRKGQAGPVPATHFAFQVKIFWICFALCLAAGALWIGALFSLLTQPPLPRPILHGSPDAQLVQTALGWTSAWTPVDVETWSYRFDLAPWRGSVLANGQARLGLASMAASVLFSWAGPIWGLVRLAAGRPIGRLPDRL